MGNSGYSALHARCGEMMQRLEDLVFALATPVVLILYVLTSLIMLKMLLLVWGLR